MPSPTRMCSHWLKSYDEFTSPISETPSDLHFWVGVSTIAGALRRRVWIENFSFQWTPNFYIILVGPPGVVKKSTSISLGYSLLRQVPGIHFGPSSLTWQAMVKALSEAQEMVHFGDETYLPMACISCAVSELGTFLAPSDDKFISVFTDLWDAKKDFFEHSTLTSGSLGVENPWVNIISATTPSWLKQNFPESMVGGGFTSRVLFIYNDKKKQLIPYPGLVRRPQEHQELEKALVHDLTQIASMVGEYKLTEEAVKWGYKWYQQMNDERPEHLESDRFDGYLDRKQGHLHKLAMILAAAQRDDLYIDKPELEAADWMLHRTEQGMVKVFESIGMSEASRQVDEMLAFLRVRRKASMNETYRHCLRMMSLSQFKEAVDAAARAEYIRITNTGNEIMLHYVPQTTKEH